MSRRAIVLLGVFCALGAALGFDVETAPATGGSGSSVTKGAGAAGVLRWRDCEFEAQCSRLEVPLDDTVEGGPTIEIALARYPARDSQHRIGSLLVNPGGPGVSGVDFVLGWAATLPDDLLDRFDIVGFDPRGVGQSAGVDCTEDLDRFYALEWAPDSELERAQLVEGVQALVDACEQRDGSILPYLSTDRAARDLDRIRAALGDEKLTYLGFSYGTYLGAWYAQQFPDRVRALVLDGAVDPALDATTVQSQQAAGFEQVLDDFLARCKRDDDCAFHSGGRPGRAYDRLRARIADTPLPAADAGLGRTLNGTTFDLGVALLLYDGAASYGDLASALAAADGGDGSDLLGYSDLYTGRREDGTYDDSQEAFFAIGCADGPPVGGLEGMRAIEEQVRVVAPRLGRSIVNNSLACALWPVAAPAPEPLHATGAPPVLVLGTRGDPATPLAWAQGLSRQLDSGRLVTAGGSRHTAFGAGNVCVDRVTIRYLTELKVPSGTRRC